VPYDFQKMDRACTTHDTSPAGRMTLDPACVRPAIIDTRALPPRRRGSIRGVPANCADFQINPALLAATAAAIGATRNDSNYFNVSRGGNTRAYFIPVTVMSRDRFVRARGR